MSEAADLRAERWLIQRALEYPGFEVWGGCDGYPWWAGNPRFGLQIRGDTAYEATLALGRVLVEQGKADLDASRRRMVEIRRLVAEEAAALEAYRSAADDDSAKASAYTVLSVATGAVREAITAFLRDFPGWKP